MIQAGWFLKTFYRCPLRALQGFLNSLTRLINQEVSYPHYSVFGKRAAEAAALLPKLSKKRSSHLIIDSSGLKLKGKGEWKDKVHHSKTHKSWIKLHLAINAKTQEITACVISDEKTADISAVVPLVEQSSTRVKSSMQMELMIEEKLGNIFMTKELILAFFLVGKRHYI